VDARGDGVVIPGGSALSTSGRLSAAYEMPPLSAWSPTPTTRQDRIIRAQDAAATQTIAFGVRRRRRA